MFYARRVRRILPASLITLVVTAIVYAIVASPVEMFDALGGFRAAFFYVANWYFIHQATDYFAANVNTNPVLHFWSLAVEEQFYFVWPLLLGALYLVAGRMARAVGGSCASSSSSPGSASAVEALHIGATNLDRAYYGTDTRAYQLLAGAALVLTPQAPAPRPAGCAPRRAVVSALRARGAPGARDVRAHDERDHPRASGSRSSPSSSSRRSRTRPGGLAKRVLSLAGVHLSRPDLLRHLPVALAGHRHRHRTAATSARSQLFAIATPTATALAALSFHLIEHPIRTSRVLDRFRTPVIAIGFTTSILIGVLVAPAILNANELQPRRARGGRQVAARAEAARLARRGQGLRPARLPRLPEPSRSTCARS